MTTFTHTTITQSMSHPLYKVAILAYIIYFMFSPQVFAYTVQAPDQQAARATVNTEVEERIIPVEDIEEQSVMERAEKIKAYYNTHNLPLADYSVEFVEAADTYGIDWRLLPAIGFIESTGGKFACQTASYSPFGWGSCKINFDSYEHAIEVVAMNLGGHNPNTEYFYKDKSMKEVLYAYNSVIPSYRAKILKEMERIDS